MARTSCASRRRRCPTARRCSSTDADRTPAPRDPWKWLRLTRDYWFLVTIVGSAIASAVYMSVFQVTPWDTYTEVRNRREQVAMHARIGQGLLERGHYELAQAEFERSLALDPLDQAARHGRYLSDLFIALERPTWDASVWSAVRGPLADLSSSSGQDVTHIIEKYLGDVEWRISNHDAAREHYEKALALNPDYLDALHTYGWFHYERNPPDPEAMDRLFTRMTERDPYDFRGFHGAGYARYMQAVKSDDAETRRALVKTATDLALAAYKLRIQQLNVAMDFGEIARSVMPKVSIAFHELGNRLLDDPQTADLPQNQDVLGGQLLMTNRPVFIDGDRQRRAWINYQLALDHLAVARIMEAENGAPTEAASHRADHARLLAAARALDGDGSIGPIYEDQLAVLERLAPIDAAAP